MNKREKLKADLEELDRIDEKIIKVEKAISGLLTYGTKSFTVTTTYAEIEIDYNANGYLQTMLSNQLSHLKGTKSGLEIELGVDE